MPRPDDNPQDELARLLTVLIRLQVENQSRAILELHRAGLGGTRIAELLGTTPGTVNVTVQRSKRPGAKRPRSTEETQDA